MPMIEHIRGAVAGGHITSVGKGDQTMSEKTFTVSHMAYGALERAGIEPPKSGALNIHDVDQKLSAAKCSTEERIAAKTALINHGLLLCRRLGG